MAKQTRKQKGKLLLLDKSSLRRLNSEQRKELDSKRTMLYPPILFAENAQHGLDPPSTLFDFKNTVSVLHWAQRAKLDLLKGEPSRRYKIGAKIPTTSIYEESETERKRMERQAIDIVRKMEASEEELKNHVSLLLSDHTKLIDSLVMNHEEIPDEKLLREFNRAISELEQLDEQGQFSQFFSLKERATLIGQPRKSIPEIRKVLDNLQDRYEADFKVDTLEKAAGWVRQRIYYDTEAILRFLRKVRIIPLSVDEQTEIFNRFENEGEPHIDKFAPYARAATELYCTIFLYLSENRKNSSPRGALRDFEYIYYALDANVTFVSSDKWHKQCIEEIPILGPLRRNFEFFPHMDKDEKEFKKVLNSIDIKT